MTEVDRKSTAEAIVHFMPAEAIPPLYNEMMDRMHDNMLPEQDNIMALRICRMLVSEVDDRELEATYGPGNVMVELVTAYDEGTNKRTIWTAA